MGRFKKKDKKEREKRMTGRKGRWHRSELSANLLSSSPSLRRRGGSRFVSAVSLHELLLAKRYPLPPATFRTGKRLSPGMGKRIIRETIAHGHDSRESRLLQGETSLAREYWYTRQIVATAIVNISSAVTTDEREILKF